MAHERMSQYMAGGQEETEPRRTMRAAYERANEVVGENPAYSALACFGIGMGVGIVLTMLLTSAKEEEEQSWYESYLPDREFVRDLADQVRDTVTSYLKRR